MTELSSGAIANMLRSWNHCWPAPWLERTVADAADRLDAQAAEIERLRETLRTIVARADDAKALCKDGHPVSAYNLASGILGQIGSDAVALRKEPKP